MAELAQTLTDPARQAQVIDDCCMLIEEEVGSKTGLSGLALKAGYKTFKSFKPGLLREAVQELLPEFATALDPLVGEAKRQGAAAERHFVDHADRVAEALLGITDRRADHVPAGLVKATYQKLRPLAKRQVEAAVPRVGRLVDKHLS